LYITNIIFLYLMSSSGCSDIFCLGRWIYILQLYILPLHIKFILLVVGFSMRCPCVRRVWPVFSRFIIMSVFLDVLNYPQGFIFWFIPHILVFCFDQWFCQIPILRREVYIMFCMYIIAYSKVWEHQILLYF